MEGHCIFMSTQNLVTRASRTIQLQIDNPVCRVMTFGMTQQHSSKLPNFTELVRKRPRHLAVIAKINPFTFCRLFVPFPLFLVAVLLLLLPHRAVATNEDKGIVTTTATIHYNNPNQSDRQAKIRALLTYHAAWQ